MRSRTGVTAWLGGADWYWSQSTISGVNAHLGRQTRQKVLLFNRSPHSALQSVSVLLLFELLGEVQRKGEKSHQGHQQRSHLYLSPIIERMWRNEPVWSDEVRASGTLLLGAETHLEQIECKLNHSYKCTHLPQRLCNHSKRCFNFILHFQNPQQKKCECFLELL